MAVEMPEKEVDHQRFHGSDSLYVLTDPPPPTLRATNLNALDSRFRGNDAGGGQRVGPRTER